MGAITTARHLSRHLNLPEILASRPEFGSAVSRRLVGVRLLARVERSHGRLDELLLHVEREVVEVPEAGCNFGSNSG